MIDIKLADKKNCTGCFACASICPDDCLHMEQDEYGFYIPVVSDANKCIKCYQCNNVCPIINDKTAKKEYPITSYAAFSNNDLLRKDSSSGGLFSEIAIGFINKGGIVYGAAYDENWSVKHIAIDDINDIFMLRTAKYSQSDLGRSFIEIQEQLNNGKHVLFAGTPCQVVGLKSFLKCSYDNLVCIDFVCHSIPSPAVWKEYVKYRAFEDNQGNMPTVINLRSKDSGWSRYKYSVSFKYANGSEYKSLSGADQFMKLFTGGYISRESCNNCKFRGYYRWSDITLGDFWGIWDIDPSMDDDKGTSLIIINTSSGRKIIESIIHNLTIKEISINECSIQNQALIKSADNNLQREKILEDIVTKGFGNYNSLFSGNEQTIMKVLKKIKRKITGNK